MAIHDVKHLTHTNIREYREIVNRDESIVFGIKMNETVLNIINTYEKYEFGEALSNEQSHWVNSGMLDFIHDHDDSIESLPILVPSNSRPNNAHHFIIHIVLSLGRYDTEVDALTHSTIRKCFQKTGLIGDATDTDSLKEYSNKLTRRYIELQLVHFPVSLSVAETFIVMSK